MKKHEIFAQNLELLRKLNDRSVGEFAKDIGIAKSTLQSVRLSGHTTLDTATRIADGLGLPLDSLVGDDRMAEKAGIIGHLIKTVCWFQVLSSSEQEEVLYHFQKVLEVVCK